MGNFIIHVELAKDFAMVIRALRNPLRLKILDFINANQELPVNAIYRKLKIEQSICSQHLKILREAQVITGMPNKELMSI